MLVPLLQDRLYRTGLPGSSIPLPPSNRRARDDISLLALPFRQATKTALVEANLGRTWVSFHKSEPDWLGVRLIIERARTWGVRLSATSWQMLVKAGTTASSVSWFQQFQSASMFCLCRIYVSFDYASCGCLRGVGDIFLLYASNLKRLSRAKSTPCAIGIALPPLFAMV
jgi:hypothetical protein